MKIKSMLSIFLIFCIFVCCISTINAQNINDNNMTDDLFSTNENVQTVADLADNQELSTSDNSENMLGDPATGSFKELQDKIDSTPKNRAIDLDKDYKYSKGDSVITISTELTINGNGKTIDADHKTAIFKISKKVILNNITFINADNGNSDGGAIILQTGAMDSQINDCKFTDNSAGKGGAIYAGCWNSKINNCEFINNKAISVPDSTNIGGGAIMFMYGDATLTNSIFKNNHAEKYGGAVHINVNYGENVVITNCKFDGNTAINYKKDGGLGGGAIFWGGKNGKLSKSEFTNNYAYSGSAIYLKQTLEIADTKFIDNLANSSNIAINIKVVNRIVTITAKYFGWDNVINAIYNGGSAGNLKFTNVTYRGINGEMNTGADTVTCVDGNANSDNGRIPYKDSLLANFEIIFEICDKNNNLVKNISDTTKINGIAQTGEITGLNPGKYTVKAIHKKDTYYTEYTKPTSFEIPLYKTTTSANDVSNKAFRSIDIVADIVDEDGNKVQNGTAILTFNGTDYDAEVSDGEATFTNVKLPKNGNYTGNINYKGNDYYKASKGTVKVEVLKLDVNMKIDKIEGVTTHNVTFEVSVNDEDGNPVNDGIVELIIHYEKESKLGSSNNGKLTVEQESYTQNVKDGKATFNVVLGKPGHYIAEAKYSNGDAYLTENIEGTVDIYKLNTTTASNNTNGKKGDKKTITADIVDQDGNPVKNGTATLTIDGKEYTADVIDGIATFENVELPSDDTVGVIYYHGNDWYNPSNTTINITIEKEDVSEEDEDVSEEDKTQDDDENMNSDDSNEDVPSDISSNVINGLSTSDSSSPKSSIVSNKSTGNPIFAILLVLFTLICNSAIIRRK